MTTMKLRTKTTIILGFVIAVSVILNYAVLHSVVFPSFVELEQEQARHDLERVRQAIDSDLTQVAATTRDWAQWDDTYQYAVDRNPAYEEENLYYAAFEGLDLDVNYVFDLDGQVISGNVFDFENEEELPIDDFELSQLSPSSPLLEHPEDRLKEVTTGIVLTARGPLLLASGAILNNDGRGPRHGTLIMGRFLSPALMEKLQNQTRVDFQTWAIGRDDLPPAERDALGQITAHGRDLVLRDDGETLCSYAVLRGLAGQPTLLIRSDTPKSITATGMQTVRVALLGLAVAGLIAMAVMAILLQRLMLGPLSGLTEHILAIARSGNLSKRVALRRGDEIGLLGREFDRMIGRLAEARDRLQQQSFQAGIAEMAAGVLHNVRNQLNPLVLRIGRLQKLEIAPAIDRLTQVLAELASEHTTPERKAKLLDYLRLERNQTAANEQRLRDEIAGMASQIARVEEVLAEQDRFSRTERTIEPTRLPEVLSHAQRMMPESVGGTYQIRIDPSVEDAPPVLAEKLVLAHVVQNLLVNAAEAIAAGQTEGGVIEVEAIVVAAPDGSPSVDLVVSDNGPGFDPSLRERIFERGFTTKQGGKGGAGLHWCANSVANLKGRIWAESDGRGRGAALHVLLATATERLEQAA